MVREADRRHAHAADPADPRGRSVLGPFLDWLFDKPLDFGGALFAHKTLVGLKDTAEALTGSAQTP